MRGQLFFDGFPVFFEVERAQVFRNQEALLGQFHDFYLVKFYFAGLLENMPLVGDYLLHAAQLGNFLLQPFNEKTMCSRYLFLRKGKLL